MPAQTQDLWHARLYLLRPLLRFTLAFLWLASGLLGLAKLQSFALPLLAAAGFPGPLALALAIAVSILDLVIAGLLAVSWRPQLTGLLQLAVIVGYTAALSLVAPYLWLDPFGPLLKNLPILVLVLVQLILAEER